MTTHDKKIFHTLQDRAGSLNIGNMRVNDCDFFNCILSHCDSPETRSSFHKIEMYKSRVHGVYCGPAIFEDLIIENLYSDDLIIVWGGLFKRVTLKGKICDLKINASPGSHFLPGQVEAFDEDRKRFYQNVDWALDISEAKLKSFDCRGIPSNKFKIDENTQKIISRHNLEKNETKNKISNGNYWLGHIDFLLGSEDDNMVLAIPLAAPKKERERYSNDLKELIGLGIID